MAAQNDGASSTPVEESACGGDASSRGRHGSVALVVASPWARYWARMFDLTIGWVVLWLALTLPAAGIAFAAPGVLEAISQLPSFWFTFFLTPLVLAMEGALYAIFGNTPGKSLLALKVLSLEGERLELGRILQRELGVYALGLGTMLPVVPLFTLIRAHHTAKDGDPQPWDVSTRSRCYSVRNTTIRTWIGAALTAAIAFAMFALGTGGE